LNRFSKLKINRKTISLKEIQDLSESFIKESLVPDPIIKGALQVLLDVGIHIYLILALFLKVLIIDPLCLSYKEFHVIHALEYLHLHIEVEEL